MFTDLPARGFPATRYVWISAYAYAHSSLWNSLHPIILPALLLGMVPEAQKNSYLGLLTFLGLALAVVAQPIFAAVSDGSRLAWGRRRPYMIAGTLLALPFLGGIGIATTFALLLVFYLLLQIASNIAQGAYQAFIPDLVPSERRGLASGAKSFAEILGVVLATLLVGRLMDSYLQTQQTAWLWTALAALAAGLLLAVAITQAGVPEIPQRAPLSESLGRRLREGLRVYRREGGQFGWFLLSRFLFILPITAVQSFAFFYMRDAIRVENPASATATMVALIALAILVLVYPVGLLSDRVGRRPIILAAGFFGVLGAVLLVSATTYEQVLAFGTLIGVGVGLFLSANWALATDVSVGEEAGKYLGLTNLATAGGAAAARLNGPFIDLFNGLSAGSGYTFLFSACALSFLGGAWAITRVKDFR